MPLHIIRQDITQMHVDAIVNTTNRDMVGYSGVDLAVHTGAGPELDEACAKLVPLGLGTAKITKGYNLSAKYIIHTSGPVWRGGLEGESIILKSCYTESLKLATEHHCTSVAFPLISSGAYGYPKDRVLKFAVQVISEYLLHHEITVYLCVFDRSSYEFSRQLYQQIRAAIEDGDTDGKQYAVCEDRIEPHEILPCFDTDREVLNSVRTKSNRLVTRQKRELDGTVGKSLEEYLKAMDKPFAMRLFDLIDEKGMTDVECYKRANIDRKVFSKIKSNPKTYKPSKQTAVAFAIALKLNLNETQNLLATAGLTLSPSFTFDKIICYFIQNGIYDIYEINQALFEFDQMCLGC